RALQPCALRGAVGCRGRQTPRPRGCDLDAHRREAASDLERANSVLRRAPLRSRGRSCRGHPGLGTGARDRLEGQAASRRSLSAARARARLALAERPRRLRRPCRTAGARDRRTLLPRSIRGRPACLVFRLTMVNEGHVMLPTALTAFYSAEHI